LLEHACDYIFLICKDAITVFYKQVHLDFSQVYPNTLNMKQKFHSSKIFLMDRHKNSYTTFTLNRLGLESLDNPHEYSKRLSLSPFTFFMLRLSLFNIHLAYRRYYAKRRNYVFPLISFIKLNLRLFSPASSAQIPYLLSNQKAKK